MLHRLAHLLSQFCQFPNQPKQNQAEVGTAKIKLNPTLLSDHTDSLVDVYRSVSPLAIVSLFSEVAANFSSASTEKSITDGCREGAFKKHVDALIFIHHATFSKSVHMIL